MNTAGPMDVEGGGELGQGRSASVQRKRSSSTLSPTKSRPSREVQNMPKLPSHPAAVSIIKELLSLLISGCIQMPDAVAILDNAASLIAR